MRSELSTPPEPPAPAPLPQACGSLARQLWAGLTRWVNRRHVLPNRKHIAAYAAELCEYEVGRFFSFSSIYRFP